LVCVVVCVCVCVCVYIIYVISHVHKSCLKWMHRSPFIGTYLIWHMFCPPLVRGGGGSHVTYARVISHMDVSFHRHRSHLKSSAHLLCLQGIGWGRWASGGDSCYICTSHVTYDPVLSHMNESRHILKSRVTYYGVATIIELLKIIGLFCKRALYKRLYSVKETYNFQEPTNRRYPMVSHVTYDSSVMRFVRLAMVLSCAWWRVMVHMNASCHTLMSHVVHVWVMSHMKKSCHICTSHVIYEWVTSHPYELRRDSCAQL